MTRLLTSNPALPAITTRNLHSHLSKHFGETLKSAPNLIKKSHPTTKYSEHPTGGLKTPLHQNGRAIALPPLVTHFFVGASIIKYSLRIHESYYAQIGLVSRPSSEIFHFPSFTVLAAPLRAL